jgi:hypothetical protein
VRRIEKDATLTSMLVKPHFEIRMIGAEESSQRIGALARALLAELALQADER